MERIFRNGLLYSPIKSNPVYKLTPPTELLTGATFSGGNYSRLSADTVQFGMNRAHRSAAAKRLNLQKQRDKKQESIAELENGLTALFDDELHIKNRAAFQTEIIKLLQNHPELPMDISLHPDLTLKNRRKPVPLLHYMLDHRLFKVVKYILNRDPNIDFSRKDSSGQLLADIAQNLLNDLQLGESIQDADRAACAKYATLVQRKSYQYRLKHPDKFPAASGSVIAMKGYSEAELKEFLRSYGIHDSDSETEPSSSKVSISNEGAGRASETAESASLEEATSKPKTQKQREAERRLKREAKAKAEHQNKTEKQNAERDAKLAAISASAKQQETERVRREADEMAELRARELNARLDAMRAMEITDEDLLTMPSTNSVASRDDEKSDHTVAPQRKKSRQKGSKSKSRPLFSQPEDPPPAPVARKTSPVLPRKTGEAAVSKKLTDLPRSGTISPPKSPGLSQTGMNDAEAKPQQSAWNRQNNLPSLFQSPKQQPNYFMSPTALSFHSQDEENEFGSIPEFSLDEQDSKSSPVVKLPPSTKSTLLSSPKSTFSTSTAQFSTPRTQSVSSWKTRGSTSSTSSLHSKIRKQKRALEEKQELLIQAAQFNAKTLQEKQALFNQSLEAYNEASRALGATQQLLFEKNQAELNAKTWQESAASWKNEAEETKRRLQVLENSQQEIFNQQTAELNTLRKLFNEQREELLKLRSTQPKEQSVEALETGISRLDTLQDEIKHRETTTKAIAWRSPFSTNPDDYTPDSGGFRVKRGFGLNSWLPEIPKA